MINLDLRGLNCPLPILKTKKFLANLEDETEISIQTTDPASILDFKDFCDKTGHILISQNQTDNIIITVIRKKSHNQ